MKRAKVQKHNSHPLVWLGGMLGVGALIYLVLYVTVIYAHPTPKTLSNGTRAILYDDVQYCNSVHPRQQMDILVPASADTNTPAPIVLYVHGGGWKEGSFRNNIDDYYPPFLLAKGIAFVTVDYRLSPEVSYPAQDNDINCAYQFLMKHGRKFNLRTSQVGFFGDSAGGQLATMQSLRNDTRTNAAAVATLYGVTDLWYQITQKNDTNALLYLGGKRDEALANQASPHFANLRTKTAFLLIHGTNDSVVPLATTQNFYNKLIASGDNAELVTIQGAGHGFGDDVGSKAQAEAESFITNFFEKYLTPTANR